MSLKDRDDDGNFARGLGDTLARVINSVTGIKPCAGCDERKERLNKWIPYKKP